MPQIPQPFALSGNWYKGNLHMHTTRSDGHRDPSDAVGWYAENRYDFTSITDHRRAPEPDHLSSPREDFLVLPGEELDLVDRDTGTPYHVVCVGVDETITLPDKVTIQEALDIAVEGADLVYVAHPYWHGHDFEALRGLKGHSGIEIYNETCEMLCGKGLAVAYWDAALKESLLWGFAADDAHWNRPDCGKAWVNVKADTLSRKSITGALRRGEFYSSTGPAIEQVEVSEDRIFVRCSPVNRIIVAGPGSKGQVVFGEGGQAITEAEFQLGRRLKENTRYLRIHAIGPNGDAAWTNPVAYRD